MFDDPKKELELLEEELLAAEEPEPAQRRTVDVSAMSEEELLAYVDELTAEKPQKAPQPQVRNFANGYGTKQQTRPRQTPKQAPGQTPKQAPRYQADASYADEDLEEESLLPQKGIMDLVILALCLTAGIVGVIAWWVAHFL